MLRKLIHTLQYLDAVAVRDACPRACSEHHTYRWPCAHCAQNTRKRLRS